MNALQVGFFFYISEYFKEFLLSFAVPSMSNSIHLFAEKVSRELEALNVLFSVLFSLSVLQKQIYISFGAILN